MPGPRATVTALRTARGGRVAVELDGSPWRVLPVDTVARAGLSVGLVLDRERARVLAREVRRGRALGQATSVLRRRDVSRRRLAQRLAHGGVRARERAEVVGVLERVGLVDDGRTARVCASALAERGWGDEAIRHRLLAEALDGAAVDAALAALAPESARAAAVVARRGAGPATARFLARRGFGEDAVEAAGMLER